MGKSRLYLFSILGAEYTIQTPYANLTTFFKTTKMPMATWRAICHGSWKKRALSIKGFIMPLLNVSLLVILTTPGQY